MKKRTKIVCTLGPSSETAETIKKMVDAGMNVVRLNFSHGTHENHQMIMVRVRDVADKTGEPIAIMQDLQGPKIRVGLIDGGLKLEAGSQIVFDTAISEYSGGDIPIDYDDLHQFVKQGEKILLNDGRAEVKILSVDGTKISGEVMVGGEIISHKGINVPDSKLDVRALTDKDKEDLKFGVEHNVDLVAISFVQTPEDILDVRYLIKE